LNLALVVLATLVGPQAGGAAEAVPIAVRVELPATPTPELREWGRELRAALGARKDEFRVVPDEAKAELVVRLDSIGPAADGTPTLNAALVRGGKVRPFSYTFGDVKADAAKLARNLRRLADQGAAAEKK